MNENTLPLDDLELFLAVARAGSLVAAARDTGVPLPTLSRRMTRLERQTGRPLFLRGKAGYALNAHGRSLAAELAGLPDIRHRIARWQIADTGPSRVRITAGFWTSRHLVQLLPMSRDTASNWVPEFLPSNANLDLARREADIGIRNRPPEHPWLARRKLRPIYYASFAVNTAVQGYVSLPANVPLTPSQRWLHANRTDEIITTASDTRLCLDMALAGVARIVLPTFVAAAEPTLVQIGDPIRELSHDEWLVSHHEARHDPPIRAALDAVANALSATA